MLIITLLEGLLILCARMADVSLGTLRIALVVQGRKGLAAVIGTLEMALWITVIVNIIGRLHGPFHIICYATGFGLGTYLGVTLENKLALGEQVLRIFTRHEGLAGLLRERGHRVTQIEGSGQEGRINLLYLKVKRSSLPRTIEIAKEIDPKLFYIVENISKSARVTSEEIFGRSKWHFFLKK